MKKLKKFMKKDKIYILCVDISDSTGLAQLKNYNEMYRKIKRHNLLVMAFDHEAHTIYHSAQVDNLKDLKQDGSGGTSFESVFKKINRQFPGIIDGIIMLTDGYAWFPKESETNGIPVLWVIDGNDVIPPWGDYTTVEVEIMKISTQVSNFIKKIYKKIKKHLQMKIGML
jgi:predicted metal-dependent peptidase